MTGQHATRTEDWTERYLAEIEKQGASSDYESLYLWPRTPIGADLQDVIARRVGVNDYQVDDPRSRSGLIIRKLRELVDDPDSPLDERFRLLDVACGDAVVLWQIKKAFPDSSCFGIDCNKGVFVTNATATEDGVLIFKGYLQHLFAQPPPEPLDVTMMLNTYRGWESADLREAEKDLPEQVDDWFARYSRYAIVSATADQIKRLRRQGWSVHELGCGEDESTLICMTRGQGGSWTGSLRSRLRRWQS
jgi:hypothetical protein